MSIATFTDLKTKAATWLRRSGNPTYVAEVPDFITLAEARLNRELGAVEDDATLVGMVGGRELDISSLSVTEPLALFIQPVGGGNERKLQKAAPSELAYGSANGVPAKWAVDDFGAIVLDCPCAEAYPFRLHHRGRFALSDANPTNWVLTNHPDVYLAATLMWGAGYLESWPNGAVWKSMLEGELPRVANQLARMRRSTLRADPALVAMAGAGSAYNVQTDQ